MRKRTCEHVYQYTDNDRDGGSGNMAACVSAKESDYRPDGTWTDDAAARVLERLLSEVPDISWNQTTFEVMYTDETGRPRQHEIWRCVAWPHETVVRTLVLPSGQTILCTEFWQTQLGSAPPVLMDIVL